MDRWGIVTLSAAVVLVLVALDRGTEVGFGAGSVLAMIVVGVVLLGAFAVVERRTGPAALVPRRVMASRQFASVVGAVVTASAIFFAILVYIPQFIQKHLGWSALAAGACLLPLMLVFATSSFVAGRLYNQFGARLVVGVGAACLSGGVLWLGLAVGSDYLVLVPGLVVVGVGVGLFYSGITTVAVTAVDPDDNSLAGGIVYMCHVGGGSLGLGLNTALVLSAGTLSDGIRTAFLVDAALGLVATVIVVSLIRSKGPAYHPRMRLHHRGHG